MRVLIASLAMSVVLASCATPPRCPTGETPGVSHLLYFGTDRVGGSPVSTEEWTGFLRDAVTPRFPDGFTAWPAGGQWRQDGKIVREDSFVLSVVHPGDADSERAVLAIAADYRKRFRQDSVLRVRGSVCYSFSKS